MTKLTITRSDGVWVLPILFALFTLNAAGDTLSFAAVELYPSNVPAFPPPAGTTSFPSDGTGYQWYVLPGTAGSYTATYNNWNSGTDYAMALMAFSPVSLGAGAVPYQMRSTRRGRRTS